MLQNGLPVSPRVRGWIVPRVAVLAVAILTLGAGSWADEVDPPRIAPSAAVQMQALVAIKTGRTPVQSKIDSRLYLGVLHQRRDDRVADLPDFRFVKPEADGRVPVDLALGSAAGVRRAVARVESLGGVVKARSYAHRTMSARVRLEDLEALAALPEVRRVRQAIPAMTHAINVSQGDLTHGALEARGFFSVTGTGVKVGVISDGVDSLAALQASGDLPATVQVLPGQAGSGDEGSAMLEIVHDLAPGADLAFATAVNSEAGFAQNILDLAAAGCHVIVDDIIYLDESPFQDGPVAQAVNTVTAAGVLYFSSAGNEGNKADTSSGTWEGDFLANGTPPVLAGAGPVHNFGDGGQSILVEVGGGSNTPPLLIWAEHYDLATGLSSTDFDLYVLNGALTTIFDASTDVQDGAGGDDFPIEFVGGGTFNGERLVVARFAAGTTSSVPMFNLIVFRGQLANTLTTTGATRGHSAAPAAFSVAATPAAASFDGITPPGPYPGLFNAANESESFTSDGPRRIILDPTGAEITPGNRTSTGGIVRQKPDITAADGVATAAPTFDPFYGTSAAAPHAAAIAALIRSAVPAVTPAQVRTALVSTAIDIEAPGVDVSTGAGIVMAHAALAAAGAIPPVATVGGTKTVAGTFIPGSTVTYTVTLTNTGGLAQADNPGDEFVDVLPAALTLVSATASSGTAAASVGTNTVTWNGSVASLGGSVTITITATLNPVAGGTTVSNQGTINFDADGNGTNESTALTDDPGVGGAADPTSFVVVGTVTETATKTVAGTPRVLGTATYTIVITNAGNIPSGDNPGDEFTDVLPASLTLVSASATSGTAVATIGTNTVTWNGSIPAGGSVTITITATVEADTGGDTVTNQGTVNYDADGNGTNESTTTTDDPAVGGANDPTSFVVQVGSYFAVTPCRVLDTRATTPLGANATVVTTLTGACGIPATAKAVALNATVAQPQAEGHLTMYPGDQSQPATSLLNFRAGRARANNAVVSLAGDGSGTVRILNFSTGTTHVVIDVTGYFE